jgi:hypothetical protein
MNYAIKNILNQNILSLIFCYLKFKDACSFCLINKNIYQFIQIAYQFSFVNINFSHPQFQKFQKKFIGHIQFINSLKNIKNNILLELPWKYLKIISFARTFNQPLEHLPLNIEIIIFHKKSIFNHQIKKHQIPNLKKIYFGNYYNKRIDFLPDSIESIYFYEGSKFNQIIRKYPLSLKEIYFGYSFNKDINLLFQQTQIKILNFTEKSQFNQILNLNNTITHLYLGNNYQQNLDLLNSKLIYLKFSNKSVFNSKLILPISLKYLYLGLKYNQPLSLPEKLIFIKFYLKSQFNHDIIIPDSIKYITFGRHFSSNIIKINIYNIIYIKFANRSKFYNIDYILNFKRINSDIIIIHPKLKENKY